MKLFYYLFCIAGAIALSNTQLIQTHQTVLQPAQGQPPAQPEAASFSSHLPDENNFQASGGATVGSFGGMARVFVMIAMFLGFLYTGVLLGGGEGSIRPTSVRSLHIPEMQEPMEPEVIPSVSFEKPSKQAAKKARRDAKRAQEAKEAEEAPVAAAVIEAAPVVEAVVSALPESPVGPVRAAEKTQKKKKEKKQREEIVEEPVKVIEEQPKVVEPKPLVVVQEEEVVTVEEVFPVEEVVVPTEEVLPKQPLEEEEEPLCLQEDIESVPLCLEDQVFEEEEETMLGEEEVFEQELEELDFMLPENMVEEGNFLATPKAQQDYVEDLLAFAMAEESLDRQAKELLGDHLPLREPVEEAENGWVKRPSRAFEPTSVTIKRARRLMNLHSLLKPSHHELDLDLGSSVVDPFVTRPVFPKLTMPPFMPEESHSLDLASQDAPTAIEPMRDKIVSPLPVVQESHPVQDGNCQPSMTDNEPVGWSFNSHKKSAWTRRQNRTNQWPEVPLPELMSYGWSPIRTPCKFAGSCKKPGCQFTHPTNTPAWNNNQAVSSAA